MITTYYPPFNFGGDGLFVRALSRALRKRGHEVHVVHCLDAYALGAKAIESLPPERDDGVVVHRLKSRWGVLSPLVSHQTGSPGLKYRDLKAIFEYGFDVVNFHNVSLMGGPSVVSMSQAPVNLYTFHDHWLLCPTHSFWKNKSKACEKRTCLTCTMRSGLPPQPWRYAGNAFAHLSEIDRFLSPSRFTARVHQAAHPEWPIEVLPTFSNLQVESIEPQEKRKETGFLFAGRLVLSKGIESLLTEFEQNGYPLDIAGVGPMEEELKAKFGRLPNVRFLGELSQERLKKHYRRASAVIVPSLAPEVFPLVCLEAMECGTPVICTRAGGCSEAVERVGGGLVYETPNQLREAVQKIVSDRSLIEKLGRDGRAGRERYYTESVYIDKYLAIVESIGASKGLSYRDTGRRAVAGA